MRASACRSESGARQRWFEASRSGSRARAPGSGPGRTVTVLTVALAIASALAGCGAHTRQQTSTVSLTPASTATLGDARRRASGARVRFDRVTLRVPAVNSAFGPPHAVTVPRGWTAEVWALVPGARLETWTPEGDLLVSSSTNGFVDELIPSRSGPPVRRMLLSDLNNPQGMAFANLGGQEYCSSPSRMRSTATPGATGPSARGR